MVTGAASGIGEAVARAFAEAGAAGVVVADLNAKRLSMVAVIDKMLVCVPGSPDLIVSGLISIRSAGRYSTATVPGPDRVG